VLWPANDGGQDSDFLAQEHSLALLQYLKDSAFSEWLSLSMLGFPTLIALHSVGMGVAVGLALMISLRLHDVISGFEPRLIPRLLQLTLWGFLLNLLTGVLLFITRGPEYLVTPIFLVKMVLVFGGAAILFRLRTILGPIAASAAADVIDGRARHLSIALSTAWFGAVVAGRLIAYLSDLYGR
jgi:hypothetical protein